MKPAEAMKIVENPEDYSKAEIANAKKVLKKYAPKTAQDITVAIGIGPPRKLPKSKPKKTEMMYGGMANGKKHNYAGGGNVSDKMNPGLKALQKEAPEVVARMLKK